ncbi:hypothetical protein [Alienimonas californiensis]|uniref:hypothetical protein n=1 Tax=Alienimonas californiensis TaxID=2527989 RepID=UPI0011A396CA|nr:hypothetical protein [Alienimonas californiensis]
MVHLYWHKRRSTDQLSRNVEALAAITRDFNAGCEFEGDQQVSSDELLHYMIVQRKTGRWVRLGDRVLHRGPRPVLTAEDIITLINVAHEMAVREDVSCCRFMFEPDLREELREHFARQSRKLVPGTELVDALISLRKDGLLPRLHGPTGPGIAADGEDTAFGDMDQVA